MINILAVDDSEENLFTLTTLLEQHNYCVQTARNGKEALTKVKESAPDLILMDVNMPEMSGFEATKSLRSDSQYDHIPVVLLTSREDIGDIREGLRIGANDYIKKPFDSSDLLSRIEIILNAKKARTFRNTDELSKIVGTSPTMKKIQEKLQDLNDSDVPVVVTGESGSGKELVVRAIHSLSSRSNNVFIAQNCSALSESLLESELFGHVRGAFTGAMRDKKGLFEVAHGGTLFLDELGEMSLPLQAKLLRVLQDGTFSAVGSHTERKADVRVIAATHRNLEDLVAAGKFRQDLFYRLHVVHFTLPPLRERPEDIPLLLSHFLTLSHQHREAVPEFTGEALKLLVEYHWPGNIRELKNEVERIAALHADLSPIPPTVLSPKFLEQKSAQNTNDTSVTSTEATTLREAIAEVEKKYIKEALEHTGGNKSEAARLLEISRSSLILKARLYFGDE